MRKNKLQQAQLLLNAMNAIDDIYLDEAISYSPDNKKAKLLRFQSPRVRALSSVAALAAVLALVVAGPLRGMLKKAENDTAEEGAPPLSEMQPERSVSSLNLLLEACTKSPSFRSVSADEIDFFDGSIRLTVQRLDTKELYLSAPLTQSQQQTLQQALSDKNAIPTTDQELTENGYAVWVTLGNGQVATPYLSPSSGNLGAAVLFRYEAERLPAESFFDLLENLNP